MSMRSKQLLWWSVSFGIMLIIFLFSAQSRESSANLSMNVRGWFSSLLRFIGLEQYAASKELHRFVRKCAHAFLYCSLGVSVCSASRNSTWRKYGLWAILICFIYALSDEVHQAFVPGRGPLASDVLLDTVSASVGVGIVAVFAKYCKRKDN